MNSKESKYCKDWKIKEGITLNLEHVEVEHKLGGRVEVSSMEE